MSVLRSRLLQQKIDEENARVTAERRSLVRTGDRSEKIRTCNFPQNRVTDHRIGLTLRPRVHAALGLLLWIWAVWAAGTWHVLGKF